MAQTETPAETRRQVAERLANEFCDRGDVVSEEYFAAFVDAIETALNNQREIDAKKAERARLPRHFQWGRDAMEQFNFGKERAAKAIREGR